MTTPAAGHLLDWFLPLEASRSLDEVSAQWTPLLERHGVGPDRGDARHKGAVLAFLARSTLPAHFRLGAVLLHVPSVDVDPRLAFGALGPALDPFWSEGLPSGVCMEGAPLDVDLSDTWKRGFLQGRLTEVWHALRPERGDPDHWHRRFWHAFWVLCCHCADLDGVRLALGHGAGGSARDCSGIVAASGGVAAHGEWQAEGRIDADYLHVIDHLLQAQTRLEFAAAPALGEAAAADNIALLDGLLARGADIPAQGREAVVMAAASASLDALQWLLAHGAAVHLRDHSALAAAAGSLSIDAVDLLLDAGADIHGGAESALCTAFTTKPYDLFAGDGHDFIRLRVEMIRHLMARGASLHHPAVVRAAQQAPELGAFVSTLPDENLASTDASRRPGRS